MEKINPKDKRKVSKAWTKEEIKNLIELYEAQPDLWDPSRSNYMNRWVLSWKVAFFQVIFATSHFRIDHLFRNIKQKLLSEIAGKLKVDSKDVSAKFHSLRTQFNRECNKERKVKSGSGADDAYTSRWEYMSSLKFLKVNSVAVNTVSTLVNFVWN